MIVFVMVNEHSDPVMGFGPRGWVAVGAFSKRADG